MVKIEIASIDGNNFEINPEFYELKTDKIQIEDKYSILFKNLFFLKIDNIKYKIINGELEKEVLICQKKKK